MLFETFLVRLQPVADKTAPVSSCETLAWPSLLAQPWEFNRVNAPTRFSAVHGFQPSQVKMLFSRAQQKFFVLFDSTLQGE